MISDTIDIDAAPGIGALKEFASAAAETRTAFADMISGINAEFGKLGTGGMAAAGPEKFLAPWKAAQAEFTGIADKISADIGRIGKAGASADAGAASIGKVGDAAKGAGEGLDLGAASATRFAESMRSAAGASADASLAIARSQKVLADAQGSLATTSIEQDAAIAQSAKARAAAQKQAAADGEAAAKSARNAHLAILGGAAAVAYGIDKAAQLQTSVTRLYTSAGESQKNLPMMTQGILGLSGQTATSQAELGQGAYMIESGGYHGKDALTILRAAAQGAKAEGAPLGEVGNALTSLMTSYKMRPSQAIAAMNQIITMVGSGKMTMAGATTALPQLLPAAAAAGLSFGQAGGALATMTQTGMSPDQAAQNLRHTIGSLQGPNAVAGAEMYQLGLDPVTLSKNLGKTGLTGTVAEIQAAVRAHTGKGGLVQLDTMNASKAATADALTMLKQMPPALQAIGKAYLDNSITQKQWMSDLKGLPPLQASLGRQFATTADMAHGFNSALKSGQPTMQTSSAALQKLLGGTVGFQTFLMLSGQHLATFQANAAGVSAAAKDAGTSVKGWSDIQHTFNYQLQSFKYGAEAAATTVGAALLPAATTAVSGLAKAGTFLAGHKTLTVDLAIAGGAVALINLGKKIASPIETALQSVGKVAQVLKIPGLDKLANIGKNSAAGQMSAAADANVKAAGTMMDASGNMVRAAGMMGDAATGNKESAAAGDLGAAAGAKGAGAAAAEAEAAAGGGAAAKVKGGAGGVVGSLLIAGLIDQQLQNPKNDRVLGNTNPNSWFNNWDTWLHAGQHLGNAVGIGDHPGSGTLTPSPAYSRFGVGAPPVVHPAPPAPARVVAPYLPPVGHGMHAPLPDQTAKVKLQVDDSSVTAAKAKVQSAVQGINQTLTGTKPAKFPPPDLSQVTAAKGKAQQAATAVQQAMQTPLQKEIKAKAPNLSAFAAAAGPARADGANISAGLASGIESNKGAVVAAAADVASAAAAAMAHAVQSHSPSRVTEKTGENVDEGLAVGMTKHTPKVKQAAMTMTAATVNSLVTGLQGGQSAVDAAMTALGKSTAKPQDIAGIQSTIAKLQTDADNALKKGIISKSEDSGIVKWLKADQAKLSAMANQRAQLEQQITDATQISQAAISNASIMNAQGAAQAGPVTPASSSDLITGMQAQADQAKQFAQQVQQLRSMGLNATSLNQIVQSGAAQGLPVAQGLTGGGKSAVQQVNQLESQITASAAKLGNEAAPVMYQAGVQAGQGLAAGLKSQLSALDGAMKHLADSMVNRLKSDLKIKSPSQVFAMLTRAVPQGAAQGVDAESAVAEAAVSRMAGRMAQAQRPGFMQPMIQPRSYGGYGGSGFGAGPGGVTIHNHYNVTVHGSVTSERNLLTSLQGLQLERANNNWQGGWHLPGRAA